MVVPNPKKRRISADLTDQQIELIKAFIQGAVYCYCNMADKGSTFAARDLFGGENYYWNRTPLMALYEWHKNTGADNPVDMAGKDLGWILLDVLDCDKRHFRKIKGYVNSYEWLSSEGEEDV